MFYNQPLAVRFGSELTSQIGSPWESLDIAVAWVRASGMDYLVADLQSFLRSGGRLSTVVGIDLQNTTYQGLQALLDLEEQGDSETYVYHNEAGPIFHPKMYLFRNATASRLIVGSNNLTRSGLFTNVEAGLQLDADVAAPHVTQALDALRSWKDLSTGLSLRLDSSLLEELLRRGYVPDEQDASRAAERRRSSRSSAGAPLFGTRAYAAPLSPASRASSRQSAGAQVQKPALVSGHAEGGATETGTALLMRLRKASEVQRPTQTQIPIRVLRSFFRDSDVVQSSHSGEHHHTRPAQARGSTNTIKLEIPEMRDMDEPLVRFQQTPSGIVYEVYDADSPQGRQIKAALDAGLVEGSTEMTQPWNPKASTWWRFI